MHNLLKVIFIKKKINTVHHLAEDEALKQWIIKKETEKAFDKDQELLDKARNALDDLLNDRIPKPTELNAYMKVRIRYREIFNTNNEELVHPTSKDVHTMDSVTLDEAEEMIDNSRKDLFTKYHRSIIEIFRSSRDGVITRPTSGGLVRPPAGDPAPAVAPSSSTTPTAVAPSSSTTPTNDFIDDHVESLHNPFEDLGVD